MDATSSSASKAPGATDASTMQASSGLHKPREYELLSIDARHRDPDSAPNTPRTPGSTRSAKLQAEYVRSKKWPSHAESPSWAFDAPSSVSSPRRRSTYTDEDLNRLSTPRAAAHGLPAKKTAAKIIQRNAYLKEKGYIESPRELLYARFHGTSAEQERSKNSSLAGAQRAAAEHMTVEQQHRLFRRCWRMGKPIPEPLSALVRDPAKELSAIQVWRNARCAEVSVHGGRTPSPSSTPRVRRPPAEGAET